MCNIERYGNVIYLIPKEENNFLGFSKTQLKAVLCKSNGTDKDYYLSQFVILTLLVEFLTDREAAVNPGNTCGWANCRTVFPNG